MNKKRFSKIRRKSDSDEESDESDSSLSRINEEVKSEVFQIKLGIRR